MNLYIVMHSSDYSDKYHVRMCEPMQHYLGPFQNKLST